MKYPATSASHSLKALAKNIRCCFTEEIFLLGKYIACISFGISRFPETFYLLTRSRKYAGITLKIQLKRNIFEDNTRLERSPAMGPLS